MWVHKILLRSDGRSHSSGIHNKDIKPTSVLVDVDNVWFTGFGMTSQLRHERQAPAPPEIISGALAYLAPKQAGRVNRVPDHLPHESPEIPVIKPRKFRKPRKFSKFRNLVSY
jgi:serine/threonine protein kinase